MKKAIYHKIVLFYVLFLPLCLIHNSYAAEKVKDGEHKEFYSSKKIKREWTIKNGKKHGASISYYENGNVQEELFYDKDELEGEQKKYFIKGNIEQEWKMTKGKRQGSEIIYFEDGHVYKIGSYKNDRRDGLQETYRKNGLLHKERNYKNGKLSGVQKDYWLNGNVSAEFKYKNGKLHGAFKTFSPDGKLVKTNIYKDGKPINEEDDKKKISISDDRKDEKNEFTIKEKFYDTGEIESISRFRNGILHGLIKEFYRSGGARSVTHYLEGLKNGVQIVYYDSGQIESRLYYVKGEMDGIQEFFYRNGVLRSRERYYLGVLDGVQEYYYENGVLLARKVYAIGNLLRFQKFIYENGVLKTIEEFIEKQLIIRQIDETITEEDTEDLSLANYFLEADIQEHYDNGNIKLELEFKEAEKIFERIYYEEGGLQFEVKWEGGNQIYYEAYETNGDLKNKETAGVHKNSKLIRHKDFCEALRGNMLETHCDIPTTDVNNTCIDSSQCQAYCVVYGAEENADAQGKCTAWSDSIDGCYRYIENGVATRQRGNCTDGG